MEKTAFKADGMSCGHCVMGITKSVGALPGIENVSVSLENKTVTVEYDPAQSSPDAIKEAVNAQGYEVVD